MKKILITGAAGSLGYALRKQLTENNTYRDQYEVILTGTRENAEEGILKLDITDYHTTKEFMSNSKPDYIINCAAYTAVDLCEDEVEKAYLVNETGAENLAKAANEIDAVLVHVSTDYVFDGESEQPYKESDPTHPVSVYGKSKLAGEKKVLQECKQSFILRTAWLYGEKKSFVKTMLNLVERGNKVVRVVNDQFGCPTSADELAKAILYLLPSKEYGVTNVVCSGSTTWYEFAKKIFEYAGKEVEVVPISSDEFTAKAPRPKHSVLDTARLNEVYGYKMADWNEALKNYLM